MISWCARRWVTRAFNLLAAGDIGPMLSLFAKDAVFSFPGDNSWAGEHRGHDEIARWLTRFASVKMHFEVRDVAVSGPPWNMTIFTHFVDSNIAADGTVVYRNAGVLYDKARWFKIHHHEDFTDVLAIESFDDYLASQGDDLAIAAVARRKAEKNARTTPSA